MKTTRRSWGRRCCLPAVSPLLLLAVPAVWGSINGPHTPDADTVFLLHLDDGAATGLSTNAVAGAPGVIASANPSAATTRSPLPGILGAAGASGVGYTFGQAANLTASNSLGLFLDANQNGVADLDAGGANPQAPDGIAMSTLAGPSGEFTLEALVNLPSLTGANREIISMDSSFNPRPFQWRFTAGGLLEFNNIGTAGAQLTCPIPTTGPEAFVANQWFHVAMTHDGAGSVNFYWTKLDNARTGATLLTNFAAVPALNQTGLAVLTIGNENRSTSGEFLNGLIDEVRVSKVVRSATGMVFNPAAPPIPPSIDPQPTDQFLGVGETLVIVSHASGSTPLSYQWQQGGGAVFTNLPGQTADSLSLPVTFATEGDYRYIVSNAHGSQTSRVARVTVGAVVTGAFPTGFDDAGVQLLDSAVDPHYTLWASAEINALGPATFVPANTADYNGNDAGSKWISPALTLGGARGIYTYRTILVLDSAVPAGVTLQGSTLSAGTVTILLNGQPTGVANLNPSFPGPHRNLFSFAITNGFIAGVNTLDFVVDNSAGTPNTPGGNALRVTLLRGVGPALPAGLPTATTPESQRVKENGKVTFATVASGRPPLSYQWYADGAALPGATRRTLNLDPVYTGGQGRNFHVVVTNPSGSATSQVTVLTIVPTNQAPGVTNVSVAGFRGAPLPVPISLLLQNARDPDGDAVLFQGADATGTNTVSAATITQNGARLLYQSSDPGFTGSDQFNVTLTDGTDSQTAAVRVSISDLRLTIRSASPGGVRLSWPATATAQGFRLRFADTLAEPLTNVVAEPSVPEGAESALYLVPTNGTRFYQLANP